MNTVFKWKGTPSLRLNLYFDDLAIGDCFSVDTSRSRGAVYRKVKERHEDVFYMEELYTGYLFEPTSQPVKRVEVEYSVDTSKPSVYR